MLSVLLCAALLQAGGPAYNPTGPRLAVTIENRGSFVITTDLRASPRTVRRVVELVRNGFFDRQRFHRVEDWVVQWGAPASRDGDLDRAEVGGGGSGTALTFEGSDVSFRRGVVGIASIGPRRGGDSQIFILTRDAAHLDGNYAVLGKVTQGMEVVDRIRRGDRITSIRVQGPPAPPGKRR
jgi:cyclophilin family peptidyl-prolyl cis-trans isomerase